MINEKISYVIPIALDNSKSGTPVLIYEMRKEDNTIDLSFGVFFIGLIADKKYSLGIDVFNEIESPIPIDSELHSNHTFFTVNKSIDGERIVSASTKTTFHSVKINNPGIFEVRASLVNPENGEVLDIKSAYFDVKQTGSIRYEFR